MQVVEALTRVGGIAPRRALVRMTSRKALARAVAKGDVVRIARGRYALPVVESGRLLAHRAAGALCLTSAAMHHGWEVASPPELPCVAVPKDRRLDDDLAKRIRPYWIDLHPDDLDDARQVTAPAKTLEMCLRTLPFGEAVAVADSALRHDFPLEELLALAAAARGPGSAQVRRVARIASRRSANPFESALKAIADSVAGLDVRPQVRVTGGVLGLRVQPDLVDGRLRVVLEADSFEWHGSRRALRRDARRYNALTVNGWLVLRFSWEDVMHEPDLVRRTLEAIVRLADQRTEGCPRCRTAA